MDPRALLVWLLAGGGVVLEQEGNDRPAQAQYVGDLDGVGDNLRVHGSLRKPGDLDHYAYRVTAPSDLRVSVVTGAISFPLLSGDPVGGMAFAPWLRVTDATGSVLVEAVGFGGNILIPSLQIDAPTVLTFRLLSAGPALYPKRGLDVYRLRVSDAIYP